MLLTLSPGDVLEEIPHEKNLTEAVEECPNLIPYDVFTRG